MKKNKKQRWNKNRIMFFKIDLGKIKSISKPGFVWHYDTEAEILRKKRNCEKIAIKNLVNREVRNGV